MPGLASNAQILLAVKVDTTADLAGNRFALAADLLVWLCAFFTGGLRTFWVLCFARQGTDESLKHCGLLIRSLTVYFL
ncbi:hypothetical protein BA177_06390 [Woeseia oceani]|uniref:Uncharacterized protein n=1 Tax=Woeseia oceani TaxID=1548547 RepID=A0A193LES6_9GAMM|nr:hypothetical protein BA177_06390 [Woeseia oceani]